MFAAATAIAAVTAFVQVLPGSGAPQLFPLAQPHMARAVDLLNGPRGRSPAVLAEAEAEARRALTASPARADAWLAVAWIEHAKSGRFSPKAAEALDRSYLVGPLDPDLKLGRLEFGFDNWAALSKALRDDALREMSALWSRTDMREDLRRLAGRIDDPAGRLAFRIQLTLLERSEPGAAGDS